MSARAIAFGVICAVVGAIAAVIWWRASPLPSYTVSTDGTAVTTNSEVSEFFGSDAVFAIIGLFFGIALGVLAWHWFKKLGWLAVLFTFAGTTIACLVCLRIGHLIGPHDFDARMAAASAGDQVQADLDLRTPTSWLLWQFGAIIPVLIYSALSHDDEDILNPPEPPVASDPSQLHDVAPGHRVVRFTGRGRRRSR